jgi:hypothetical protein
MTAVPDEEPGLYRRRIGSARPNSLLYTGGVGALVDLPQVSVVVRGLDSWDYRYSTAAELTEPRLLARVQQVLGKQVRELRAAPFREAAEGERPGGPADRVGVPVSPFPRWLRCTRCNLIAGLNADGGGVWEFQNDNPYRPDKARFVHRNCDRAATTRDGKVMESPTVPARFVVACEAGHLDEFPYVEYVHRNGPCKKGVEGRLTLHDPGGGYGGRISLRCSCGATRALREALSHHNTPGSSALPACRGRHPHLGVFEDCGRLLRAMVLGASNQWFGIHEKALFIPDTGGKVFEAVDALLPHLKRVPNRDALTYAVGVDPALSPLRDHDLDAIWAELVRRRDDSTGDHAEPLDLTAREYEALCDPDKARNGHADFTATVLAPPDGWGGLLERVVKVSRLRETKALVGFTRIDAPEFGETDPELRAPLVANRAPTWLPAAVTRGEGIVLKIRPDVIASWEAAADGSDHLVRLRAAYTRWRTNRDMAPPHESHWPGDRYVLLHTLSHLLIREITLECGYSSASISERVYAAARGGRDEAAILLYTSASDSEGTFGGLVRLAEPRELGRILERAFCSAQGCSSDPLCAEHAPLDTEDTLHGAACHACLFASETSCERGNRFLDRRLIVPVDDREADLALQRHLR